jgi:hypothetical protein
MPRLSNEDGWRQARELFMMLAIQLHAAETAQDSFRFPCKSSISGIGIEKHPSKKLSSDGCDSNGFHQ